MSHQKQALDLNEALATSEAFLIKYRKWVIGVGIAVVVLIGAWGGGYYYLKNQNEQGQYEISLGEQYVQTGDWNKAIKGDGATFKGYEKIARNYAWADAANIAHLYCGLAYFNLGNYKKARRLLAEGRRHGVCQRLGGTGQCLCGRKAAGQGGEVPEEGR